MIWLSEPVQTSRFSCHADLSTLELPREACTQTALSSKDRGFLRWNNYSREPMTTIVNEAF